MQVHETGARCITDDPRVQGSATVTRAAAHRVHHAPHASCAGCATVPADDCCSGRQGLPQCQRLAATAVGTHCWVAMRPCVCASMPLQQSGQIGIHGMGWSSALLLWAGRLRCQKGPHLLQTSPLGRLTTESISHRTNRIFIPPSWFVLAPACAPGPTPGRPGGERPGIDHDSPCGCASGSITLRSTATPQGVKAAPSSPTRSYLACACGLHHELPLTPGRMYPPLVRGASLVG